MRFFCVLGAVASCWHHAHGISVHHIRESPSVDDHVQDSVDGGKHESKSDSHMAMKPLHDAAEDAGDFAKAVTKFCNFIIDEVNDFIYTIVHNGKGLPKQLEGEGDDTKKEFLPEWEFKTHIFYMASATVLIAFAWFGFYFNIIYHDDRSESLKRWEQALAIMEVEEEPTEAPNTARRSQIQPDIVIVFHHPDEEVEDGEEEVETEALDRVRVDGAEDALVRLDEKRARAHELDEETGVSLTKSRLCEPMLYKKAVRTCILQDLYKQIQKWGFDVSCFSSLDGDELFVCISLNSKEAITHYIDRDCIPLQLRADAAERLGIDQDHDDPCSSPPSIPYDRRTMRGLYEQGIITNSDGHDLFRTFAGSGKESSMISSMDCIRLVYKELASCIDIAAAKEEDLIVGWYPVHNPTRIAELRAMWANYRAALDLRFVQPIPAIKDYYGSRIAFIFAWNGVYCKGLLALVAIAVAQVGLISILKNVFGIYLLKNRQVIGFCIVLCGWSRIVWNLYEREQRFFIELWNLQESKLDAIIRPEFVGSLTPSVIDKNIKEKTFPGALLSWRLLVSNAVTLISCITVASCIFIWMITFEGKMGMFASILLTVQIKTFGFLFHNLAVIMTDYENHKFQDDYHNSFLLKLFVFEAVNNYMAFFFLTIRAKGDDSKCPNNDCLFVLRKQLATTLCLMAVFSMLGVVIQNMLVRYQMYREDKAYKEKFGRDPPPRKSLEEQAKFVVLSEKEEVMSTMMLMISLGYVLLFGGVSAVIAPLALIVFAVQLRAYATLLTAKAQRPLPEMMPGIGNWAEVVRFLMTIGVVYSGFLFAAYGETFQGAPLLARMTGCMVFCLGIGALWSLIDVLWPVKDGRPTLLNRRRDYVATKLMHKAEAFDRKDMVMDNKNQLKFYADEIENKEWSKIPPISRHADSEQA